MKRKEGYYWVLLGGDTEYCVGFWGESYWRIDGERSDCDNSFIPIDIDERQIERLPTEEEKEVFFYERTKPIEKNFLDSTH